jgi:starvation-inducible DNA-binding protein
MSITSQLNVLINLLINQYYIYKFFHWNFEGEDFYSYHQLFDSHATSVLKSQDVIAEKVRTMQSKVVIEPVLTPLKDIDINQKNLHNILNIIINQHNEIVLEITEIIKLANFSEDFGTTDLLTQYLEEQQKMLWFIQSSNK